MGQGRRAGRVGHPKLDSGQNIDTHTLPKPHQHTAKPNPNMSGLGQVG